MTQGDKELLLKDLSARLPYKCVYSASRGITHWNKLILSIDTITKLINNEYDEIKPYLRPLYSMTEEEKSQYNFYLTRIEYAYDASLLIDWLNVHHFDYRGLIPKGLALEAPKGIYLY